MAEWGADAADDDGANSLFGEFDFEMPLAAHRTGKAWLRHEVALLAARRHAWDMTRTAEQRRRAPVSS